MNNKSKISRKKFIKGILYLLLLPFGISLESLVKTSSAVQTGSQKISLPKDLAEGFSFFDNVIVYKQNDAVNIYSSRCTHLGCKINKQQNGNLICPCHGSKYNPKGEVIEGPASKNLPQYNYNIDHKTGKMIVKVS